LFAFGSLSKITKNFKEIGIHFTKIHITSNPQLIPFYIGDLKSIYTHDPSIKDHILDIIEIIYIYIYIYDIYSIYIYNLIIMELENNKWHFDNTDFTKTVNINVDDLIFNKSVFSWMRLSWIPPKYTVGFFDDCKYGPSVKDLFVVIDHNENGLCVVFPRMKLIDGNIVLGQGKTQQEYTTKDFSGKVPNDEIINYFQNDYKNTFEPVDSTYPYVQSIIPKDNSIILSPVKLIDNLIDDLDKWTPIVGVTYIPGG
jgi:hypothetical protein